MAETDKGTQKPVTSEQGGSKNQQRPGDYPVIPTILQHSADEESHVYRGSNKAGSSL